MSYCSWAKKNFRYRESVGDLFCGFTLYNREDFVFREPIGDALTGFVSNGSIMSSNPGLVTYGSSNELVESSVAEVEAHNRVGKLY